MLSRSFINWSGGKDSAFALWKLQNQLAVFPELLLTNVNERYGRVSMHGVRKEMVMLQAKALDIPLETIELPELPSMEAYEQITSEKLQQLKNNHFDTAIFGDIFLEDLKQYRESQLAKEQIKCLFPLWNQNTKELLSEFIRSGFKTIVVCVNEKFLDKSFCGRIVDDHFLNDLPADVDPCGENGEFHTFVVDAPNFRQPIRYVTGELTARSYPSAKQENDNCFTGKNVGEERFYFLDLLPG